MIFFTLTNNNGIQLDINSKTNYTTYGDWKTANMIA
jgi:hypothetical protein